MGKRIDINDIAKMAGVSRSTVSRVLTNHKNVKPETAKKIHEVMLHCNYRPNHVARGLATGKINIIAMVVSNTVSPFNQELLDAVNAAVNGKSLLVGFCNTGNDSRSQEEGLRDVLEYGFSTVVIANARNDESYAAIVKTARCPVVFLNRHMELLSDYDAITIDNYLGGCLATRHLIEHGHSRIAMLTGPRESTTSAERLRGYVQTMRDAGLSPDESLIHEGDLSLESGYILAHMLFNGRKPRVSAVFAGSDMMAIGVINRCREMGVRVPEDLSIVGFDGIPLASSSIVNLTTVQHPFAQMGQLVAERVFARINGDDSSRQRIILIPKLVVRNSVAKASV